MIDRVSWEQRIEEKLDKITELALNHAVLAQEVRELRKSGDGLRDTVVAIQHLLHEKDKELLKLEDRQKFILRLLGVCGVIVLALFGITI